MAKRNKLGIRPAIWLLMRTNNDYKQTIDQLVATIAQDESYSINDVSESERQKIIAKNIQQQSLFNCIYEKDVIKGIDDQIPVYIESTVMPVIAPEANVDIKVAILTSLRNDNDFNDGFGKVFIKPIYDLQNSDLSQNFQAFVNAIKTADLHDLFLQTQNLHDNANKEKVTEFFGQHVLKADDSAPFSKLSESVFNLINLNEFNGFVDTSIQAFGNAGATEEQKTAEIQALAEYAEMLKQVSKNTSDPRIYDQKRIVNLSKYLLQQMAGQKDEFQNYGGVPAIYANLRSIDALYTYSIAYPQGISEKAKEKFKATGNTDAKKEENEKKDFNKAFQEIAKNPVGYGLTPNAFADLVYQHRVMLTKLAETEAQLNELKGTKVIKELDVSQAGYFVSPHVNHCNKFTSKEEFTSYLKLLHNLYSPEHDAQNVQLQQMYVKLCSDPRFHKDPFKPIMTQASYLLEKNGFTDVKTIPPELSSQVFVGVIQASTVSNDVNAIKTALTDAGFTTEAMEDLLKNHPKEFMLGINQGNLGNQHRYPYFVVPLVLGMSGKTENKRLTFDLTQKEAKTKITGIIQSEKVKKLSHDEKMQMLRLIGFQEPLPQTLIANFVDKPAVVFDFLIDHTKTPFDMNPAYEDFHAFVVNNVKNDEQAKQIKTALYNLLEKGSDATIKQIPVQVMARCICDDSLPYTDYAKIADFPLGFMEGIERRFAHNSMSASVESLSQQLQNLGYQSALQQANFQKLIESYSQKKADGSSTFTEQTRRTVHELYKDRIPKYFAGIKAIPPTTDHDFSFAKDYFASLGDSGKSDMIRSIAMQHDAPIWFLGQLKTNGIVADDTEFTQHKVYLTQQHILTGNPKFDKLGFSSPFLHSNDNDVVSIAVLGLTGGADIERMSQEHATKIASFFATQEKLYENTLFDGNLIPQIYGLPDESPIKQALAPIVVKRVLKKQTDTPMSAYGPCVSFDDFRCVVSILQDTTLAVEALNRVKASDLVSMFSSDASLGNAYISQLSKDKKIELAQEYAKKEYQYSRVLDCTGQDRPKAIEYYVQALETVDANQIAKDISNLLQGTTGTLSAELQKLSEQLKTIQGSHADKVKAVAQHVLTNNTAIVSQEVINDHSARASIASLLALNPEQTVQPFMQKLAAGDPNPVQFLPELPADHFKYIDLATIDKLVSTDPTSEGYKQFSQYFDAHMPIVLRNIADKLQDSSQQMSNNLKKFLVTKSSQILSKIANGIIYAGEGSNMRNMLTLGRTPIIQENVLGGNQAISEFNSLKDSFFNMKSIEIGKHYSFDAIKTKLGTIEINQSSANKCLNEQEQSDLLAEWVIQRRDRQGTTIPFPDFYSYFKQTSTFPVLMTKILDPNKGVDLRFVIRVDQFLNPSITNYVASTNIPNVDSRLISQMANNADCQPLLVSAIAENMLTVTSSPYNLSKFTNPITLLQDALTKAITLSDNDPEKRAAFFANMLHESNRQAIANANQASLYDDQTINKFSAFIQAQTDVNDKLKHTQAYIELIARSSGSLEEKVSRIHSIMNLDGIKDQDTIKTGVIQTMLSSTDPNYVPYLPSLLQKTSPVITIGDVFAQAKTDDEYRIKLEPIPLKDSALYLFTQAMQKPISSLSDLKGIFKPESSIVPAFRQVYPKLNDGQRKSLATAMLAEDPLRDSLLWQAGEFQAEAQYTDENYQFSSSAISFIQTSLQKIDSSTDTDKDKKPKIESHLNCLKHFVTNQQYLLEYNKKNPNNKTPLLIENMPLFVKHGITIDLGEFCISDAMDIEYQRKLYVKKVFEQVDKKDFQLSDYVPKTPETTYQAYLEIMRGVLHNATAVISDVSQAYSSIQGQVNKLSQQPIFIDATVHAITQLKDQQVDSSATYDVNSLYAIVQEFEPNAVASLFTHKDPTIEFANLMALTKGDEKKVRHLISAFMRSEEPKYEEKAKIIYALDCQRNDYQNSHSELTIPLLPAIQAEILFEKPPVDQTQASAFLSSIESITMKSIIERKNAPQFIPAMKQTLKELESQAKKEKDKDKKEKIQAKKVQISKNFTNAWKSIDPVNFELLEKAGATSEDLCSYLAEWLKDNEPKGPHNNPENIALAPTINTDFIKKNLSTILKEMAEKQVPQQHFATLLTYVDSTANQLTYDVCLRQFVENIDKDANSHEARQIKYLAELDTKESSVSVSKTARCAWDIMTKETTPTSTTVPANRKTFLSTQLKQEQHLSAVKYGLQPGKPEGSIKRAMSTLPPATAENTICQAIYDHAQSVPTTGVSPTANSLQSIIEIGVNKEFMLEHAGRFIKIHEKMLADCKGKEDKIKEIQAKHDKFLNTIGVTEQGLRDSVYESFKRKLDGGSSSVSLSSTVTRSAVVDAVGEAGLSRCLALYFIEYPNNFKKLYLSAQQTGKPFTQMDLDRSFVYLISNTEEFYPKETEEYDKVHGEEIEKDITGKLGFIDTDIDSKGTNFERFINNIIVTLIVEHQYTPERVYNLMSHAFPHAGVDLTRIKNVCDENIDRITGDLVNPEYYPERKINTPSQSSADKSGKKTKVDDETSKTAFQIPAEQVSLQDWHNHYAHSGVVRAMMVSIKKLENEKSFVGKLGEEDKKLAETFEELKNEYLQFMYKQGVETDEDLQDPKFQEENDEDQFGNDYNNSQSDNDDNQQSGDDAFQSQSGSDDNQDSDNQNSEDSEYESNNDESDFDGQEEEEQEEQEEQKEQKEQEELKKQQEELEKFKENFRNKLKYYLYKNPQLFEQKTEDEEPEQSGKQNNLKEIIKAINSQVQKINESHRTEKNETNNEEEEKTEEKTTLKVLPENAGILEVNKLQASLKKSFNEHKQGEEEDNNVEDTKSDANNLQTQIAELSKTIEQYQKQFVDQDLEAMQKEVQAEVEKLQQTITQAQTYKDSNLYIQACNELKKRHLGAVVANDIVRVITTHPVDEKEIKAVKAYVNTLKEDPNNDESNVDANHERISLLRALIESKVPLHVIAEHELAFENADYQAALQPMLKGLMEIPSVTTKEQQAQAQRDQAEFLLNHGYAPYLQMALLNHARERTDQIRRENDKNKQSSSSTQEDPIQQADREMITRCQQLNLPSGFIQETMAMRAGEVEQEGDFSMRHRNRRHETQDEAGKKQQQHEAKATHMREVFDPSKVTRWGKKQFNVLKNNYAKVNTDNSVCLAVYSGGFTYNVYYNIQPGQFISFVDWKEAKSSFIKERIAKITKEQGEEVFAGEKLKSDAIQQQAERAWKNEGRQYLEEKSKKQLEAWVDEDLEAEKSKELKKLKEQVEAEKIKEKTEALKQEKKEDGSCEHTDDEMKSLAGEHVKQESIKQEIEKEANKRLEKHTSDEKAERIEQGEKFLRDSYYVMINGKIEAVKATLEPNKTDDVEAILKDSRALIDYTRNKMQMTINEFNKASQDVKLNLRIQEAQVMIDHLMEELMVELPTFSSLSECRSSEHYENIKNKIETEINNIKIPQETIPKETSQNKKLEAEERNRKNAEDEKNLREALEHYATACRQNAELLVKARLNIGLEGQSSSMDQELFVKSALERKKNVGDIKGEGRWFFNLVKIDKDKAILTIDLKDGEDLLEGDVESIVKAVQDMGLGSVIFTSHKNPDATYKIAQALQDEGILVELKIPDSWRKKDADGKDDRFTKFEKRNKELAEELKAGVYGHFKELKSEEKGAEEDREKIKAQNEFIDKYEKKCKAKSLDQQQLQKDMQELMEKLNDNEKTAFITQIHDAYEKHSNNQYLALLLTHAYMNDFAQGYKEALSAADKNDTSDKDEKNTEKTETKPQAEAKHFTKEQKETVKEIKQSEHHVLARETLKKFGHKTSVNADKQTKPEEDGVKRKVDVKKEIDQFKEDQTKLREQPTHRDQRRITASRSDFVRPKTP